MKHQNAAPAPRAPKKEPGKPFREMSSKEKAVYLLRVLVCILTFGLVFPNAFG